jgi:hypothetical protein
MSTAEPPELKSRATQQGHKGRPAPSTTERRSGATVLWDEIGPDPHPTGPAADAEPQGRSRPS